MSNTARGLVRERGFARQAQRTDVGPVSVSEIVMVGAPEPSASSSPPRPSAPASKPREPVAAAVAPPSPLPMEASRRPHPLQVLFSRGEDATADSPLTYRERVYLMPPGASVVDAEEALYGELEAIQHGLAGRPLGRFVMLSMFDEPWEQRPSVQPVVVLEWRDWKGAPVVRYPAAEQSAQPALRPHTEVDAQLDESMAEDRLAIAFEALSGLSSMVHAAQALDYVAVLLEQLVPCDALAACLYDINDDCLRIVAARGHGAGLRTGSALPRARGLLGSAVHIEDTSTVFDEPQRELGFVPAVDGCAGLETRSLLVRPISLDGQLLGALQLLNRRGRGSFGGDDIHVVDYIARQLADALAALRTRPHRR